LGVDLGVGVGVGVGIVVVGWVGKCEFTQQNVVISARTLTHTLTHFYTHTPSL